MITNIVAAHPVAFAGSAIARSIFDAGIDQGVLMSMRTMSDRLGAPRLIDLRGHGFKMFWPNALAVRATTGADVIPFLAFRWLANQKVVSKARGIILGAKCAISISVKTPKPQGTTVRSTGIDSRPETFNSGRFVLSGRYPVSSPEFVMRMAPTTGERRADTAFNGTGNGSLCGHRKFTPSGVMGTAVGAARPLYFTPSTPILRQEPRRR